MNGTPLAPLAGITVADFSELLPGPFFTQSLAEMGARVIKIERPPHGDNARRLGSGVFEAVNRGKESRLVDLKDDAQRAQIDALLTSADVLVESYRPGVMARLGLDAASLCARFPRLVYVSLSGYGQNGPWAQLPGHDINYLAAAGALAVSGSADGGPAQSFGLPVADLCAAMYALSSTLAALWQRERTGRGQHLDVAIADCVLHWMNPRFGAYREAGAQTLDAQRAETLTKPAYGAFACRDGHHLSIAALEDHFWQRLCTAIDLRPFDDEAYRSFKARKAEAGAINWRIAEVLTGLDSGEAFERLCRHDVPAMPVMAPGELSTLAPFTQRGRFRDAAPLSVANYPVTMTAMASDRLGDAPDLGAVS